VAQKCLLRLHRPDIYYAAELTEFERRSSMRNRSGRGRTCTFPRRHSDSGSPSEAQQKTAELLTAKAQRCFNQCLRKTACSPRLTFCNRINTEGQCSIYEIKSSTQLEDEHLYDLAYQVVLLRKAGRSVTRACPDSLNPNYNVKVSST